jgi:hypothetical protein
MKTTIKRYIALCAVSLFIQKSIAQHQISIQTGAFNYFFDNVPLQTDNDQLSLGLQYQYQKSSQKLIATQFNIFLDANQWGNEAMNEEYRNYRRMQELNVVFSNQNQLYKKLIWTYGVGPTLRKEWFALDTLAVPITNPLPYDIHIYQSHQLQLGMKGQISITYTPFKWLTMYSQLQLSGYLLSRQIGANYNNQLISDFGFQQRINFPSRFHSSLTFGVGINF